MTCWEIRSEILIFPIKLFGNAFTRGMLYKIRTEQNSLFSHIISRGDNKKRLWPGEGQGTLIDVLLTVLKDNAFSAVALFQNCHVEQHNHLYVKT